MPPRTSSTRASSRSTPKRATRAQAAAAAPAPARRSEPVTMFVRLKRYNARRGYVMRKYTHLPTGKKFEESSGWYKVNSDVADALREVHQRPRDEESPFAFDICTKAEAEAIDTRERKEQTRREAHGANDLTTRTLRRGNDGPSPEITPVDERQQARAARIQPGTRGTRSMRAAE